MPWFELELLLKIVGIGFICSVIFSVIQKPKISYDGEKYTVSVPVPSTGRFAVFRYDFMEKNGHYFIKPRLKRLILQFSLILALELMALFTGLAEKTKEECNIYIIFFGFVMAVYFPPLVIAHIYFYIKRYGDQVNGNRQCG